jgi:competence protein ComEA
VGRVVARVPVRVDPGRRAAIGVGIAVVVAAAVTGAWVLAARPSALPVSSTGNGAAGSPRPPTGGPSSTAGTGRATAPASSPSATLVVVDVAGRVRRPGVYRLPAGSRIDDALRAAGGARPGVRLDALNLAAKLIDGQQVAVGVPPAPVAGADPAPGGGSAGTGGSRSDGSAGSAGGPVNLNTATAVELQRLPGVGPVLAQHILDWRTQHGQFASVDQLDDVTGIGDVKFAALKPLVTT